MADAARPPWWMTVDLAARLGTEVRDGRRIAGGDTAEAWQLDLADGRRAFAKLQPEGRDAGLAAEAAGLRWLADADAIPTPAVLAAGEGPPAHLVLAWIAEGGQPDEPTFGAALARLHAAGAPAFGRQDGLPVGALALPNRPTPDWRTAFATQRLAPLADHLRAAGFADLGGRLHGLADGLDRIDVPVEPPARLHGDLWAGNRLVDRDGTSWLVDPMAHAGHRESDLAMMALFGGFGPGCWDGYQAAHPLADGWQDRVALHQVPPLAEHVVRFGRAYAGRLADALDRYT